MEKSEGKMEEEGREGASKNKRLRSGRGKEGLGRESRLWHNTAAKTGQQATTVSR